jgi:hypothetical protein
LVGVDATGSEYGMRGRGTGADALGGIFQSERWTPQIRLDPARGVGIIRTTREAHPVEYVDRTEALPFTGALGDIWCMDASVPDALPHGTVGDEHGAAEDQPQCHLWLCVRDSQSNPPQPARWAQLLLGAPQEGGHR